MHVVIFTGGVFAPSSHIEKILKKADYIIAADSGASAALALGIVPSLVIGDFDSLPQKDTKILQEKKVPLLYFPQEKDETDTELALEAAVKYGATRITILGAVQGDRFDHILATLFLSFTTNIPIQFLSTNQTIWIEKGPARVRIVGKKGDLLSLIPLREDVVDITSSGLYYPLNHLQLFFGKPRGVSNVLTKNSATVAFAKGSLLFVHTTG